MISLSLFVARIFLTDHKISTTPFDYFTVLAQALDSGFCFHSLPVEAPQVGCQFPQKIARLAKIASCGGDMYEVTCGDSISLSTLDATRNVDVVVLVVIIMANNNNKKMYYKYAILLLCRIMVVEIMATNSM